MITHVVLFRPRASLTDAERRSFADAYEAAVRTIPSIRRARIGRRVTHGRAYESLMREDLPYAAILEFDDVAGLQAYLRHPSHEVLGAKLFEASESVLVYDYEMGESVDAIR